MADGGQNQPGEQIQPDEYYMKIACLVALRSKDPSTPVSYCNINKHYILSQVGACIVDENKQQIVGIGYNSMPYVKDGKNDKHFPWQGHDGNVQQERIPEYKDNYGNKKSITMTKIYLHIFSCSCSS